MTGLGDAALLTRLTQLKVELGGTFVFHRTALRERLAELCGRIQGMPVRLGFPIKTAPIPAILGTFAEYGFALEVSNLGELELAAPLDTELWLNGPAAVRPSGVARERTTWILSSPSQIDCAALEDVPRLGLRLNAGPPLSDGEEPSQLGLELEQAAGAAAYLHDRGKQLHVLHAHANRQLGKAGYQQLLGSLLAFRTSHAPEARVIDIGGGQFTHFRQVEDLAKLISELTLQLPAGVELGLESGGAHFAEGIYFLAPVIDVIERSTRYDVIVGACLSAALQWSSESIGLFGGSAASGKPVRIAGASCDDNDHRGTLTNVQWDRTTRKPQRGAPVVFCRVSPYAIGRSFGFNGIPKPGLVVMD